MARLGRISSDRKKIEAISANKTVEKADCGTIFTVSETCALTLPCPADIDDGWWCKIVLLDASKTVTVQLPTRCGTPLSRDVVDVIGVEMSDQQSSMGSSTIRLTGTAGVQLECIAIDDSSYSEAGKAAYVHLISAVNSADVVYVS